METANKLVYSKENYYTENGYKYKIKTTISLDDDCHNNMYDWSITADILGLAEQIKLQCSDIIKVKITI